MDHNIPLITTLAAGFGIALALGFIAERLKFPALVGYLVAGILMVRHTGICRRHPYCSQCQRLV